MPNIDILLAGPPCQGHSDLNNHTRRKDERNELYERVGQFAELAKPKFVLIENVPNIIHSHEKVLQNTVSLLESCGYTIDTGMIDLVDLGVPQKRKRHVLVASLLVPISVHATLDKYRYSETRDVKWAIEDLEHLNNNDVLDQPTKHSIKNLIRIKYLFDHDLYDLPDEMRPRCHQNGHTYKSMYGRINF